MGMAASQARFLGLTARKSNVEYEGQQVNQQRTALANESASLYSQLANLTVPTPPDITQYYKTEYSFKYNDTDYTFTSLPIKNSGNDTYTLGLSYEKDVQAFQKLTSTLGLDLSNVVAQGKLSDYDDLKELIPGTANMSGDTVVKTITYNNNVYCQIGEDTYKYYTNKQTQNIISQQAKVTTDKSGNYETIMIPEIEGMTDAVSVSTSSVQDTAAYNQAMNEYEQDKAKYEKKMAEINNKTEVIQQQDKTLELRLNQLDTEQNAISTEMDAVTKVIEKNVEKTFKTFA